MVDRLRELIAVNRAIVGPLDYDEVLHLIVDKTAAFTRADACLLVLSDPDGRARVMASRGVDDARAASFDAAFDERMSEDLRALLDFRTHDVFMAVPVMTQHRIRGMLVVHRRGPEPPVAEEDLLVRALADQAAIALEHASRYREAQRRSEHKSRLLEAIQSNTSTYLAFLGRDLRFLEANAAYCEAVGTTAEALVGRPYGEVFPEAETRRSLLERVCETGRHAELRETPHPDRQGEPSDETAYWDWTARPVMDDEGNVEGVVISALDVTHRVRARTQLETASRAKDEFLAMLAHELRNPLAAISSAMEILRGSVSDDPKLTRVSDAAVRQVTHMRRLLDDLLDVSRITSRRIELRREVVDLGAIVTQGLQLNGPLIVSRRHALSVSLASEPLLVHGDPDRLLQVVSNLLTNAAKYADTGGHIWISVGREGNEARVSVRDNGVGISPEALPHVFDLFVQADRGIDRSQGGLGIGLTIVKRLVQMHGGRVQVHSEGRGHGSEFVLWLPVLEASSEVPSARGADAASREAHRRILVAEDNEDAAEMLKIMLEIDGHHVSVAKDGEAALEVALRDRPEIVLLDIGLPRMDGYEVARRLRQQLKATRPLIIALTGYGREEDRRRAEDAGIDHHLVKPVDPEQLRRLLA